MTVKYHTLGCKLNFSETSTIGEVLAARGFRRADVGDIPDIIVVNTCSVTELADKKSRQTIRHLIREYPKALVVVTGCYAQLKSEEVASIPGVDIVLGSDKKGEIIEHIDRWLTSRESEVDVIPSREIKSFTPSCSRGDRTRYFLKVQDGCDYYCSYCTIPRARGASRSGTIAEMVAQARKVASEGGKEIVITGVNTGDFGRNTGETFFDLLRALDEVEGIERYRISSIEPNLLTDEIIEFVASSKRFMPHFHIPLQCGSDEVLKIMRRRYDTALYASKVEYIKRIMPDAYIGVDLMVGMRGETEEMFNDSRDFCSFTDITKLHVFPYSERPATLALTITPVVSTAEKNRRTRVMLALSEKKQGDFEKRFVGSVRPVLFEQPHEGSATMQGFTDNYLRVEVPYDAKLVNKITDVKITEWHDSHILRGEIVK